MITQLRKYFDILKITPIFINMDTYHLCGQTMCRCFVCGSIVKSEVCCIIFSSAPSSSMTGNFIGKYRHLHFRRMQSGRCLGLKSGINLRKWSMEFRNDSMLNLELNTTTSAARLKLHVYKN